MNARTVGTGPVHVIALHGWFGTAASWLPTLDWLNPDVYTVALPDYRGYGSRIEDSGEYTIAEIVTDVLALADVLDWPTFDVLGHSMGGKAAQLTAARAPDRVRRIIAVTPVPPTPLPFDDDTLSIFRGAATDMADRARIIASSTGYRHSERFVDMVVADSRRSLTDAFAAYFESWRGDDITADVSGMSTPITVIAGEHDNALTADVMRQAVLPFYPNSELHIMAAAGHYPIFETPVALATVVDAALAQPLKEAQ